MTEKLILASAEQLETIVQTGIRSALSKPEEKRNEHPNLTIGQAVEFLQNHGYPTSRSSLYKLTSTNRIPHRKFGKWLIFQPDELLKWAEIHTKNPLDSEAMAHISRHAARKSQAIRPRL